MVQNRTEDSPHQCILLLTFVQKRVHACLLKKLHTQSPPAKGPFSLFLAPRYSFLLQQTPEKAPQRSNPRTH